MLQIAADRKVSNSYSDLQGHSRSLAFLTLVNYYYTVPLLYINSISYQIYTRLMAYFPGQPTSRYQKGRNILILMKKEMMGGNGISWTRSCKSVATRSNQITTPTPHHCHRTEGMMVDVDLTATSSIPNHVPIPSCNDHAQHFHQHSQRC